MHILYHIKLNCFLFTKKLITNGKNKIRRRYSFVIRYIAYKNREV